MHDDADKSPTTISQGLSKQELKFTVFFLHAICEHVIHYTSSKDSLKLIYSEELFTREHCRTF